MDSNINHGNSNINERQSDISHGESRSPTIPIVPVGTGLHGSQPTPYTASSTQPEGTTVQEPARTPLQTTLIMLALCTAVFLAAIDTVILTTALPTIAADLHASTSGFAWIGSSFLLANAASMPFWGRSSDIFGRKPLLLLANSIFMLGSLVSGVSHNLGVLLAGRAVQGVGAGGLTVLVNIIVSDLFSMRRRALMLALVGSVWSFASTIGPVMGGALAEKASWRWCFWINLPCNAASLVLLTHLLKIHTTHTPLLAGLAALDWLGGLTLTCGTLMVLLGLDLGGATVPWHSPIVLSLVLLGVLTLVLFIIIEYKFAAHPIMPLSRILTAHSNNAATLLVCTAHGICYISVAYFLPLYFQSVLGFSPIVSGIWSLAMAGTLLLTTLCCGAYMHATGRYVEIIFFGFGFLVLGFGLFTTLPATLSVPRVVLFQIAICLGIGALLQPPLVALQAHLEPADMATGTATFGFVRMLSAGFSIVIGQVIFQGGMRGRFGEFVAAGIAPDVAQRLADGSSITGGTGSGEGLTEMQMEMVRGAQAHSLSRMWIFYTIVAALGLLAGFGIRRKEMSRLHVEMKTGLESMTSREASTSE